MTVTKQFITDISSAFESYDSDRIDRLVVLFGDQIPASRWGSRRDLAIAYLVMHSLTVGEVLKGKGAVTKERIGDIERNYADPSSSENGSDYNQTSWGQAFLRLRRQIFATMAVT